MPFKTLFHDEQDVMEFIAGLTRQELIPETLVIDRGPSFVSKSVQSVTKSLTAQVETSPSYRPDWKAHIERHFKTMNATLIRVRNNVNASPAGNQTSEEATPENLASPDRRKTDGKTKSQL